MFKKDSRQLQKETFATISYDITTIIYALLSIPVFSSLILTMCKLFIHTVLPKTLVDFEKSNVNLIDKLLNITTWLVKFLSKSATIYIKGIQKILSAIPKYKKLKDEERKKIAVGIYYTITIGFAIKVIKTIMIKKGISADGSSINIIKQSIIDGLKATTHEFDFDNIDEDGSEALFSKGALVPVSSLLSGQISKLLNINEQSLNEIEDVDLVNEGVKDILTAMVIAGAVLLSGKVGYDNIQLRKKWTAAYEKIEDSDPEKAARIKKLIAKHRFTSSKYFGRRQNAKEEIESIIDDFNKSTNK